MSVCVLALLGATSLFVLSSPATASDGTVVAAAEAADMANMDPIVVTGQRAEYGVKSTSTATRTDTSLVNVPQSVSVVTKEFIRDQAFQSMGEVVRYVPGVTPHQGE